MKTVSNDKSYIDFTRGNYGVRVWKDRCQAICREDERSDWVGRESIVPLPVPDSIPDFRTPAARPLQQLHSKSLSTMTPRPTRS